MIELAFIACLAAAPTTCRNESLLFVDVPLVICVQRGQIELASWTEKHPGWVVQKWLCRKHHPKRTEA